MALAAAALPCTDARAQSAEPVVINVRPDLETFRLVTLDLALEMDFRADIDEVDPTDTEKRRDTELRFREFFEVTSRSYIGHENLVQLDTWTRIGLTQRKLDVGESGSTQRLNETLTEFDISALILQKQTVPITVYARRTENDIDRQFGGSLVNTTDEYGIHARVRSEFMPFNVRYFHRESTEDDRLTGRIFNLTQDNIQLDSQSNFGNGHILWWDYEYNDVGETGELRSTLSYTSHEANAVHSVDFGSEGQHNLRTAFRYLDQAGDININQYRINPVLRLNHSRTLKTWTEYLEEHLETRETEQVNRSLRGTVRHQLFQSLSTFGQVGARTLEVDSGDFTSDEYFGTLTIDYTKRVPLGRFSSSVDLSWSQQDDSSRGTAVPVVNQPTTFNPSGFAVIIRRNIQSDSVVVTDLSGLTIYTLGTDYDQRVFPDRLELRIIAGGAITNGETVLVDYVFGPEPSGSTTTTGYGVRVRYDFQEGLFRGLSLYANLHKQDQDRSVDADFDEEDGVFLDENVTDLRYGAEYQIWDLYFNGEYRDRDSTLSPFKSTRLEGQYSRDLGRGSRFILNAYYDEVENTNDNLKTESTTLIGSWRQRLTRELQTEARVIWRLTEDNLSTSEEAFEQIFEVNWRHRQTEVFARVRHSDIDSNREDREYLYVFMGVRREF